jgi:hypothetical protein
VIPIPTGRKVRVTHLLRNIHNLATKGDIRKPTLDVVQIRSEGVPQIRQHLLIRPLILRRAVLWSQSLNKHLGSPEPRKKKDYEAPCQIEICPETPV